MAGTSSSTHVLLALMSSLFLMVGACSESPEPSDIEVGCRLNSDCPAGQVCDEGQCIDSDVCLGPDCPCLADEDCQGELLCQTETGNCVVPRCFEDADCGLGQVCLTGTCETDVTADRDRDGVPDTEDSCPETQNAEQEDNDLDGLGDACDLDDDDDGRSDLTDNCPLNFNPLQGDANGDGQGNACDEAVSGASVVGALNFLAGGNPDTGNAQVFITGRDEPVGIDAQGVFVFDQALAEPGQFALRVQWPGFVTLERVFDAPDKQERIDVGTLVLSAEAQDAERAVPMRGLTTLQGKENHQGILVQASIGGVPVSSTLTNARGLWVLSASRVEHTVAFSSPGFVPQEIEVVFNAQEARFEVDGEPLEEAVVALRPELTATVSGRLESPLDIEDWSSRALITLTDGDGQRLGPVLANGSFEIANVRPGPYSLRVTAVGHLLHTQDVVLEAGDEEALGVIVLTPEFVPFGAVVVDQAAEPVLGVSIRARRGALVAADAVSGEDGAFALQLTPETHTLSFTRQGFVPHPEVTLTWNQDAGRFEVDSPIDGEPPFVLERELRASVTGEVESLLGEFEDWPARAFVTLISDDESVRRLEPVTNADQGRGRFQIADVPLGTYTLSVSARGHLPHESTPLNLSGGELDVGVIAVQPEAIDENQAVVLQGVATLSGRADHTGITVQALIGNTTVANVATDDEGQFAFLTSRDGHSLVVSKENFVTARFDIAFSEVNNRFEVDGQPLNAFEGIVLQPSRDAAIDGQLSSPIEGLDLSDAVVVLEGGEARQVIAVEPNGTFSQGALSSGLYVLEVELDGHEPISRVENLGSGDNSLGTIELAPIDVTMLGKVVTLVDGNDEPVEGVTVRLRRDDRLVAATETDERGEFVFGALPVAYSLSMSAANFLPQDFDVEFDGQQFTVDGEPLNPDTPLVLVRAPESDRDADGVIDVLDNCPEVFNPDLNDIDGDGLGDACDGDTDGDGFVDGLDNCPFSPNPMQEDTDGLGLGSACTLGTTKRPIDVICGLNNQRLDTRNRVDALQGSCGGTGAPEVVYSLNIEQGQTWTVDVESRNQHAIYLIDAQGREVDCAVGVQAQFGGEELSTGLYHLVIDGLGSELSAGAVGVSIRSPQSCNVTFSGSNNSVGNEPRSVALGDLNGDGFLDIVTANALGDSASVLLGDGQGAFEPHQQTDVGDNPNAVALGDLNGDGFLDIVTADSRSTAPGNDSLSVRLGDGQGGFAPQQVLAVEDNPRSVALGDLNGDGFLDIVAVNAGQLDDNFPRDNDDSVSVLLGDGQGAFPTRRDFDVGDFPHAVALGDLNGDGFLDIVATNANDDTVSALFGDGQGDFERQATVDVGDFPHAVALGDLNDDGFLDIVTANRDGDDVSALLGNGIGGFALQTALTVGTDPSSVALGDLNGDGFLDIATTNEDDNTVSMLFGDGLGAFAPQSTTDVGGNEPSSLAFGDIDGDGNLDVIASKANTDSVRVLLNKGPSPFSQQITTVGDDPNTVVSGDINGDGFLDFVALNVLDDTASIMLGTGRGAFNALPLLSLSNAPRTFRDRPSALALGDLNGDGHTDIVVTHTGSSETQFDGTATVLIGNGQGSFALLQPVATVPGSPQSVALGDINGNGHTDIVTANSENDTVSVLNNLLGNGLFLPLPQTQFTIEVGRSPRSVTVGDLNGDGHTDIIPVILGAVQTVLLGEGQNTFTEQSIPRIAGTPRSVVLGDINGDGHTDIIAARSSTDDVSVLLGDGQDGFDPPSNFAVGDAPISVALGDIDGDGRTDIVTANSGNDTISVLIGDGQGDFGPQTTISVGGNPRSVTVGDINGNGLADILVANEDDNTVSALITRGLKTGATRHTQSNLPVCAAAALSLQGNQSILALPEDPCRIDRLEFDIVLPTARNGLLSLTSPLLRTVTLTATPDDIDAGLMLPERFAGLARFESHALAGLWTLTSTGFALEGGQMVINTFPDDPLAPDTLANACNADQDQVTRPDFVCRLEGESLQGITLEDGNDEDVFLLEGDFDGAFIRGQTVGVTVTAEPDSDLTVDLRAFRAFKPLTSAEESEPGVWTLSFVVPPEYSGRYFAVHVRGNGVDNLSYDLSAGVE